MEIDLYPALFGLERLIQQFVELFHYSHVRTFRLTDCFGRFC